MFDDDKNSREVATGESALSKKIKDSAKEIWLAGLGAFAKSESKEDVSLFSSLVSDGKSLEKTTRKQIDKQITHVKDAALGKVDEIRERAVDSFSKLEKALDERVTKALSKLHIPTKEEVEALEQRVDELTAALEKLSGGSLASSTGVAKTVAGKKKRVTTRRKVATKKAATTAKSTVKKSKVSSPKKSAAVTKKKSVVKKASAVTKRGAASAAKLKKTSRKSVKTSKGKAIKA